MDLRLAICGSISKPICFPSVEQTNFQDFPSLNDHIDTCATTRSFIVLFVNLNHQHSQKNLDELRQKSNVFAIYICVKSKTNFSSILDKVYPVTRQFLAHQLHESVMKCFQQISMHFLSQNNAMLAMCFRKKADEIKRTRRSIGSMFEVCDVLIVPMNVSEDILYLCFSDVIDLCNDLCPDNEPIVRLIDNYFPLDENTSHYDDEYLNSRLNFLKKMGPIRLYLFGNEITIVHPLSKLLHESEITNDSNRSSYDENCTCIEYEPITGPMKSFILEKYMQQQQWDSIDFRRLDYIRNDIHLLPALDRARSNREGRVLTATNELNPQSNNSIQFSTEPQLISQSHVNTINSSNEEINMSIQCSPHYNN